MAACGSPWVSTMRSGCAAGLFGQPVVHGEMAAHLGLALDEDLATRLAVRPGVPTSVQIVERTVEVGAVAELEVVGPGRADHGRGVEPDDQVEHRSAVLRRRERAVDMRPPLDMPVQREGEAVEPAQDLTLIGGLRRDDELESVVPQRP